MKLGTAKVFRGHARGYYVEARQFKKLGKVHHDKGTKYWGQCTRFAFYSYRLPDGTEAYTARPKQKGAKAVCFCWLELDKRLNRK